MHTNGERLMRALNAASQWADETFPHATQHSRATHLIKEAEELRDDPADPNELADCLMLIGHIAAHAGIDMAAAVENKLAENRTRTWGPPDADGVSEHV